MKFNNEKFNLYDYKLNVITDMKVSENKEFKVCKDYSDDFDFEVSNEGAKIAKYKGNKTNVFIPDRIVADNSEKKVYGISQDAFKNCSFIKSIKLSSYTRLVGDGAFNGCRSLESINNTESIFSVGNNAFLNCTSLKSISFQSINKIGMSAFENCKSLTKVDLGETIGDIQVYAFSNCSSLEEINIAHNAGIIRYGAFNKCTSLKRIKAPGNGFGSKDIANDIFTGCNSIESVELTGIEDLTGQFKSLNKIQLKGEITEVQFLKSNVNVIYDKKKYDLYDLNGKRILGKPKVENGMVYRVEIKKDSIYDVNDDGVIDTLDLSYEAEHYNSTKKDSNWDENLDFNQDGICDIYDIVRISEYL